MIQMTEKWAKPALLLLLVIGKFSDILTLLFKFIARVLLLVMLFRSQFQLF